MGRHLDIRCPPVKTTLQPPAIKSCSPIMAATFGTESTRPNFENKHTTINNTPKQNKHNTMYKIKFGKNNNN
jgi:hypothetical protein